MKAWIEGRDLVFIAESMSEHATLREFLGGIVEGSWVGIPDLGHISGFRVQKVPDRKDVA